MAAKIAEFILSLYLKTLQMKTIKIFLALVLFSAAPRIQAAPADLKASINTALKNYLEIKNALATDNSKAANEAAQKFTASLKEVSADQMDAKQKEAWKKYGEKLRFDGQHIGESTEIAHQREHFGSLSANMYAVLKVFKNNEVALYQQYCPMKKQSWLSKSATIKNPYFGKSMIECGVTKEALKPAK